MLYTDVHARIAPLDRARSLVTLLVLHHAALNYIHFGQADPKRGLGFDLNHCEGFRPSRG